MKTESYQSDQQTNNLVSKLLKLLSIEIFPSTLRNITAELALISKLRMLEAHSKQNEMCALVNLLFN